MSGQYNRKDHFYKLAKDEGFRSRASYKLLELSKSAPLLKPGFRVLDLGCWPGGWLQVAAQCVGESGLVVGIDLVALEDLKLPQVKTFCADARDDASLAALKAAAPQGYDTVLSDMSPKLSGIREVDQAASVGCAELALFVAEQMLKGGGSLVIKVFKGNDTEQFIKTIRPRFGKLSREELDSTRKSSNEFYLVGLGFKG